METEKTINAEEREALGVNIQRHGGISQELEETK